MLALVHHRLLLRYGAAVIVKFRWCVSNLSFYRLHSSLPSPVVLHQSLLFSPHSGGLTFQLSPQQCIFSMSLPVIPPAHSASACGARGTDLNSASKGQYSRVRSSTYFGRHNIHAAHTYPHPDLSHPAEVVPFGLPDLHTFSRGSPVSVRQIFMFSHLGPVPHRNSSSPTYAPCRMGESIYFASDAPARCCSTSRVSCVAVLADPLHLSSSSFLRSSASAFWVLQ
jgi:hypothetical protein